MPSSIEKAETVGGIAVICGLVTGFAAFLAALLALVMLNVLGAGVCLGAAGISFGLAANAAWRD